MLREVERSRGRGVEGGPSRFTTSKSTNQIQKKSKKSQNQLHNSTTPQLISKSQNLKDKEDKDKVNPARHAPIKDSGAKRPVGARAAEEEVPDRVRERLRLRVGREAHRARRAAEATRSVCTRRGGRVVVVVVV